MRINGAYMGTKENLGLGAEDGYENTSGWEDDEREAKPARDKPNMFYRPRTPLEASTNRFERSLAEVRFARFQFARTHYDVANMTERWVFELKHLAHWSKELPKAYISRVRAVFVLLVCLLRAARAAFLLFFS